MSSNGKSDIPSNEEIVEELTKDLKNISTKTDSRNDDTSHCSESESENEPQENEETEIKDADYIDDKLLKERDDKLSDEEKRVSMNNNIEATILKKKVFVFKYYLVKFTNASLIFLLCYNYYFEIHNIRHNVL